MAFNKCNQSFTSAPDLYPAPAVLRELCGRDADGLIDEIVGGIEDAENTLYLSEQVDKLTSMFSIFQFNPLLLAVDFFECIRFTIDRNSFSGRQLRSQELFVVYRLNPKTGAFQSSVFVHLRAVASPSLRRRSWAFWVWYIFRDTLAIC